MLNHWDRFKNNSSSNSRTTFMVLKTGFCLSVFIIISCIYSCLANEQSCLSSFCYTFYLRTFLHSFYIFSHSCGLALRDVDLWVSAPPFGPDWMDFHEIWFKHFWFPGDESRMMTWVIQDFFLYTALRLTFPVVHEMSK